MLSIEAVWEGSLKMNAKESIEKAIEIVGGAKELAEKMNVSYKSVLDWKNGRVKLSPINCVKMEKLTDGKVKREDILPEYPWNDLR
jgi:DNA-binding transcriptional regulator YdaS (Cro superfamily)